MSKRNPIFKTAVHVILGIYIALMSAVLAMGNNFIAATIPEDHYFELVGALALFVTSILFLYGFGIARKTLDKSWISLAKQQCRFSSGLVKRSARK